MTKQQAAAKREHNVNVVRVGLPNWPLEHMTRAEIARAADLVGRLTVNECATPRVKAARRPAQAAAELKRLLATLQQRARGPDNRPRAVMTDRDRQIDALDEAFHDAAAELMAALQHAHSDASADEPQEAFGRVVKLARAMIVADENLKPLGEDHESRATAR